MELQVINTLSAKRREIQAYIASLERDIEQARRDLSAILAAEKVFSGEGAIPKSYMNMSKVFPRHEIPRLCKAALEAANGPQSTKALALSVINAKGLDATDRHLRKAVAYKIVQHMRRLERERKVARVGKEQGVVVWLAKNQQTNV